MKKEKDEHRKMPDPVPCTPEELAKMVLNTPPKKKGDWDYLKKNQKKDKT